VFETRAISIKMEQGYSVHVETSGKNVGFLFCFVVCVRVILQLKRAKGNIACGSYVIRVAQTTSHGTSFRSEGRGDTYHSPPM
jgi:hypothetical protein